MAFLVPWIFQVSALAISLDLSQRVDASDSLCPVNELRSSESLPLYCDLEAERALLNEMESILGSAHRTFAEKLLAPIKQSMLPIFTAVSKNDDGSLSQAAASYVLSRVFVHRHAWFLKGLDPFKTLGAWDSSDVMAVLKGKVPDRLIALFRSRAARAGFALHDLVVFAATVEQLVQKESLLRLTATYRSLNLGPKDIVGADEMEDVMDSYMSLYILGGQVNDLSTVSAEYVRKIRGSIDEMYPGFPETQTFVRGVQQSVAAQSEQFYFPEVANLVEEVGSRYGRWQDTECRTMKDNLLEMEDSSPGGAGKVLLADFYNAAVNGGKWQFREHVGYLRMLGALDETDPQRLRVIIPNYVNAPSNCVASSRYYSICCVNECEELIGRLEAKLAKPYISPSEIISAVEMMPSSTMSQNRTLPLWLLDKLHEVADHHGGLVPLHGRLFAQWMHFAYPRECQYPHGKGALQPLTESEWAAQNGRDSSFNETEMQAFINASRQQPSAPANVEEGDAPSECALWTTHEELVVRIPPRTVWSFLAPAVRFIMFAALLAAAFRAIFLLALWTSDLKRSWAIQDKYDL